MKLSAIHLKSFRAAVDLTVPLDARRVLIAGENHAGKSTVREGIRWALTGRATVTDAKGGGAQKLIPEGCPAASVVVEVAGLGGVSRSYGTGATQFTVEGFTGSAPTQQQALYDRLETNQAYLDAVLDTGLFLRMHHIDAKAIVLALLNVQIEVDGELLSLDAVDGLFKQAFENRKAAKLRLKTVSVPPLPTSPQTDGSQPPTVEQIDAQLAKVRGLLETAAGATGNSAGRRAALVAEIADLEQRIADPFTHELSEADAQAQVAGLERAITDLEATLEQAVAPKAQAVPADVTQQAAFYRDRISTLVEHRPTTGCVLDGEVPCETAKIKFTNRAKALQVLLDQMGPAEAPSAHPVDRTPLQQARKTLQGVQSVVARYAAWTVEAKRMRERVTALEGQLAALPADAVSADDIATLRGRVQRGEALLRASRDYWSALYAHQEGVKAQAALTAEVAGLEKRCDLLGPNGQRASALASAIGAFEARINAGTQPFGWTVAFTVDPWGVDVNGRPVETYSESEQYLIGLAIQLSIAEVSGLSFAVVDRYDVLDVRHRRKALDVLTASPVQQILVLATREPSQPMPAAGNGMLAIRLQNVNGRSIIAETVQP